MTLLEKGTDIQFATDLLDPAEKELAAFAHAVSEMFGPEHVCQSVDDWIEELELMAWPPDRSVPDLRHVTVAAATRLARRTKNRC